MEISVSDDSDTGEFDSNSFQELSSNGYQLCRACKKEIYDKYYLRVNEYSWHEECLKCDTCNLALVTEETCFIKKNRIFCKLDYYKNFGIKCAKCTRNIQSSDWVRRARDNVYHLACFACETCKRQLSTGEEFALQNNKLLCKTHYCESIDGESGENSRSKNKRVRTTFTEEQLQVLQANFEIDSNPDGQDLERIAQITGLSKRVTQVWFQNSRARQKKYKEKKIDLNCSLDLNDMSNDDLWNDADLNSNSTTPNQQTSSKSNRQKNHQQQQQQQTIQTQQQLSSNMAYLNPNCYNQNINLVDMNNNNNSGVNSVNIKSKKNGKNKRNKNIKNNIDSELNLSWGSDNNSMGEDDVNETSLYDSSLEYNHGDVD